MSFPDYFYETVLSDMDPGEAYQKCVKEFLKESRDADYEMTELVVYATEVRYALEIIQNGLEKPIWNFGDLDGTWESRLAAALGDHPMGQVAFIGSGPYPVTALLLHKSYPDAKITCVDNNITAYLLSEAVFKKLGLDFTNLLNAAIEVDYTSFDVVIVAAMVSGKQELVEKILAQSAGLVLVRGTVALEHPRLIQFGSTFTADGALTGSPA